MSDTPGESEAPEAEGQEAGGGSAMAPGGGDVVQYVSGNGQVDLSLAVEGVAEGTACSFEVKKVADDSVVTTIQGQVVGGKAVGVWAPALDPDAGDRGVRVYYVTTVESHVERSPELEVYLDYIDIESQDKDGNPLPDATYELRVTGPGCPPGGVTRRGRTGSTGKIRETAVPPGEAILEWVGPFELVAWVDDSGPTRKAKLKKVERMRFAWPSPEGEGGLRFWMDDGSEFPLHERFFAHTQLVNFTATDTTRATNPERGNVMRFRVTASPAAAGLAGAKVFVKVVWAPADQLSKRTTPRRQLVGGSTSLPWATGEGTQGLQVTLAADQGEATFDVDLGRAGGDVCTVHVGGTSRCEDAQIVVTNRRTVGYQLTRKAHQSLPSLTDGSVSAVRYLDQLFVDFEQVGADTLYTDGAPLDGADAYKRGVTTCPASWFDRGASGDAVLVGAHNFKWFNTKFRAAEVGSTGVHLVLADQMVHGVQPANGRSAFAQAFSDSFWSGADVPRDDGTDATDFVTDLEYFARVPNTQGTLYQVFPQAIHDGGLTLRARWQTPGDSDLEPALRGQAGDIPTEWLTVDRHRNASRERFGVVERQDGRFGVWITFPPDSVPARALELGKNVSVTGTMYVAETGVLGLSGWEQIVVKLGGVSDAVQNHALAHEVGHNLRQAACREGSTPASYYLPPGFTFADHPMGYVGKGHLGSHCSTGLTDEERAQGDYTQLRGTCVMFGGTDDTGAAACTGFCDLCKAFGRAVACTDLHRAGTVAAIGDGESGAEPEEPPPVVEVALQNDPRDDFPRKGKLEVTAGGAAAPAASLVAGGAWAFATIGPEAGKSYKIALTHGGKSHTLLDEEDLEAFAQAGAGATAVNLVVLARKAGPPPAGGGPPTFDPLTVTAAGLIPPGALSASVTLDAALGAGRTGDVTTAAPGVYTLRVTCEGEAAPIDVQLILGPPDDILLESPAQGCTVLRVRAGRPGAWGARWFFVTVAPPSQRILIAPSNNGGDSDLYTASGAADELKAYYKKKGFAADIMRTKRPASEGKGPPKMCESWDALIARLEGAEAEPYSRLFTIGHGGWDGTMMDGSPVQISPRMDEDHFWRFTDAIKKGMTPDGKIYFSSCHGGGSNAGEEAEHEKIQADAKKLEADATAKKAAAEKRRDAATSQADKDRFQAEVDQWDGELANAQSTLGWIKDLFVRWSEEVARATGRVASGPMGLTSTGKINDDTETRTLCNARAALEGEGVAKQALWLTIPSEQKSYCVNGGKNATTKDSTFRGKPIVYPGPLARTGTPTTPATTTPGVPTTAWVPPPQVDIPAPVAATD